jgi:hypothetical protein
LIGLEIVCGSGLIPPEPHKGGEVIKYSLDVIVDKYFYVDYRNMIIVQKKSEQYKQMVNLIKQKRPIL